MSFSAFKTESASWADEASKQSKYVETKISEGLRLNLPLVEIPQNIHITSHQLLSDEGLISMTEALRTVSGIQKYYGGLNDYQLIIRGTVGQFNVLRNGVAGFWWNQQEYPAAPLSYDLQEIGPKTFALHPWA